MEGGQKQPVPDPVAGSSSAKDVSAGGGVPPTELIFDVRTVRKVPWK